MKAHYDDNGILTLNIFDFLLELRLLKNNDLAESVVGDTSDFEIWAYTKAAGEGIPRLFPV